MNARARRAVPLIAAALTAVIVTSLLYVRSELHPVAVSATPSPSPVPRLAGGYTPAFDFVDPRHGWAIVNDTGPSHRFWIFVTSDGAAHWKVQFTRIALNSWTYIRFFDLEHGFAYAGSLYRTVDGGASWQDAQLPTEGPFFDFSTPTQGWMVGDELYTTEDGGATWTAVDTPIPEGALGPELVFRPGGEGWAGAQLDSPVVYLTEDGGRTWQPIALPLADTGFDEYTTSVRLLPGHAVLALVGSPAGFVDGYYSRDEGASWHQVRPLPQPEWLADASFLDSTNWWVSRYGFLYRTSNAGQSWTRVAVQPLPEGWNIGPAHVIDETHAWWTMVATNDSRDNALMMTSNGGRDWRAVDMPQPT